METHKILDVSALERAALSLDEAIIEYKKNTNNTFVRDACIQRFEYTYELGCKMLKRYLALSEPVPEAIAQMAFPTLIRTACERGLLLNGWDRWSVYRYSRNLTSHTYNEQNALTVCDIIPFFLDEVNYLLLQLHRSLSSL